jgi:anthranilate synthase/aminodeoxychorismate synthase-like glutamine amidotransferase
MVIVIDNYDSFTYNLVQFLGELGKELEVYRNDAISVEEIEDRNPTQIVVSPGPGKPENAGVSKNVIRHLGPKIPTLGVCLGHQCIGEVFGGKVSRAKRQMHGKTSKIFHSKGTLYEDVTSPFIATRYHSLIVEDPLPNSLDITAITEEGEIMGIQHKHYPIHGVQFHPESILTKVGKKIINNFLNIRP